MRPAAIVVTNVLFQDPLQMPLVDRNQIIKAFPSDGADQTFTERVRFRSPDRSLQNAHTETLQGLIGRGRENLVAIMDQEAIRMIECEEFAKLLSIPRSDVRLH